jgi:hypothetical protein
MHVYEENSGEKKKESELSLLRAPSHGRHLESTPVAPTPRDHFAEKAQARINAYLESTPVAPTP